MMKPNCRIYTDLEIMRMKVEGTWCTEAQYTGDMVRSSGGFQFNDWEYHCKGKVPCEVCINKVNNEL